MARAALSTPVQSNSMLLTQAQIDAYAGREAYVYDADDHDFFDAEIGSERWFRSNPHGQEFDRGHVDLRPRGAHAHAFA